VRYDERSSTSRSWLFAKVSVSRPRSTNFVLVAFTKDSNRVMATALLHTWSVCSTVSTNPLTQSFCSWMDETFCHGKPVLDSTDLPYSLTRILSLSLFVSMLLSFCAYRPLSFRISPWMDPVLSLLEQPTWHDIVRVNACVNPALKCMHRMVAAMIYDPWSVNMHMVVGSMILLAGIGIMGNGIAAVVTGRHRVTGLDASIGGCLSYQRTMVVGSSLLLLDNTAYNMSSSHYFWFTIVTHISDRSYGRLVAFLAGAMLGHGFGLLQRDVIVETFFARIMVGWRRFLDKWLIMR